MSDALKNAGDTVVLRHWLSYDDQHTIYDQGVVDVAIELTEGAHGVVGFGWTRDGSIPSAFTNEVKR